MTTLEAAAVAPGVIAGFVGCVELRSDLRFLEKLKNIVPVILTILLVIVYFSLDGVINTASSSMPWLAGVMTVVALLLTFSGALVTYSRKSSSILMASAGLILAFYWAFTSVAK